MNIKNLLLLTITSSAIAFSGAAFSADNEKSEPTGDVKTEHATKPAKKPMKPHNHMRDAKGMGMADKADSKDGVANDAQKDAPANMDVKPHNHPRDAK